MMSLSRRSAWVAGALLLGTLGAACGGDDAAGTTTAPDAGVGTTTLGPEASSSTDPGATANVSAAPPEEDEPVAGGELSVLVSSETVSMDPIIATGSSGTQGPRFAAVYGGLVTYLAATSGVEPWMAEALAHDDTFTTWTLTLRDGLVFSDGTPFDAEAVRVNWARAQDPANRSPSYFFATSIESMAVVDASTLVVTLTAPNAHFDNELSRRGLNYIASPAAIDGGALGEQPVGAGPFVVDDWRRDDRMHLVRSETYFDAPRPYLDELTFRVVPEEQSRVDTFATGDGDAMYSNITTSLTDAADAVDGEVYAIAAPDTIILMPNNSKPPFDDVRMRRVLALAIDRDVATDLASPGSTPAHSFTLPGTPWDAPANALPAVDLDEAQRLVDGVVAERGPQQIEVIASGTNVELSEFVQAALNQLDGLDVAVNGLDSPTFIQRVRAGDYHLVVWGLPWLDPDVSIGSFFETGASSNYSAYSNADVDALIQQSRVTADLDERAAAYQQVFAVLADELPVVPMHHGEFGWAVVPEAHGFTLYEDGIPRWDQIWLQP